MTMIFHADLADLGLADDAEHDLSSAIEDRAATMFALGCSLDGIATMTADVVERDGYGCWPVMVDASADGSQVVLGVLTEASAGAV